MVEAHGVVVDGHFRACSALEPLIRAEVAAEYAERLSRATLWERWRLQREMAIEIQRRIHQKAPPDALY